MNAVATKTVTTEDTGETIDGVTVLGDYHENGGYDWMELIEAEGWAVIPSWGCDGWPPGSLTTAGPGTSSRSGGPPPCTNHSSHSPATDRHQPRQRDRPAATRGTTNNGVPGPRQHHKPFS